MLIRVSFCWIRRFKVNEGVMLQDLSLGCESHLRQADLVPLSGPKKKKRKEKVSNGKSWTPEPPKCKVKALSIAPGQLTTEVFVKLIIFNAFAHEILSLAACDSQRSHEENHLRFSNSKHFRFTEQKKHFISEWYFTKIHGIGSLVVRKVKTSWDSRQNRELVPTSLGSRRAIADLFVMFVAWTSQKASKVHKPLSQSWL